jgi:uncharacterized protein
MTGELALVAGLVAYSGAMNLWGPFNRSLYVPFNASLMVFLAWLALGPLGLSRDDLGLDILSPAHLAWGALAGAALAAPALLAAASPRAARRIADRRIEGLEGWRLAYQVLVRVPVGTAATEELVFRGVLFAAWLQHGLAEAWIVSSVTFGLWHVSPTVNLVRANRPDAGAARVAGAVAVAVAATTAAGASLVLLRYLTGSLLAPWALHAALNSVATMAAARAHRTLQAQESG